MKTQEHKELEMKLAQSTKKIVGNAFQECFVIYRCGMFVKVATESAVKVLEKIWKKNPEFTRVKVEPVYEEVDVFDETGELVDIINGQLLGYRIAGYVA